MISLFNQSEKQKLIKKEAKDSREFIQKFADLMFQLNLKNKFSDTFGLYLDEKTDYGYKARLYIAEGLSFLELQKKKHIIEENLFCIWNMEIIPFSPFAPVTIMTKPLDQLKEYETPKLKNYEMWLGVNFDFKPIIINCNKNQHFLFSGATGSGKTSWVNMILLSWILSCKPEEIEIYLADISKDEFCNYADVSHIRYYANSVEELYKICVRLRLKVEKRIRAISQLRKQGIATNIYEFNAHSLKNKLPQMTYCFLLIDEFSIIIPEKHESEKIKSMKNYILDSIKFLSKESRSGGVFVINGTQKVVKDELPSIIKNQAAVRVSFRSNDEISSQVIMGNNSAVGLPERTAVYSITGGGNQKYLFSPYITTDRIEKLLKPHIQRNKVMNIDSTHFQESFEVTHSKVTRISKVTEVKPIKQIIERDDKYEYH